MTGAVESWEAANGSIMRPLGILRLDTRFPRIYGDAGNPATWPFPVRIRTVPAATAQRVVRERSEGLLDTFIREGLALAAEGVSGITTTCGFLCLHQRILAAALPVPFASSSLLQVPVVARTLPSGRVGVITVDRAALTPAHLAAVGIDPDIAIEQVGGNLAQVLLGDGTEIDTRAAIGELTAAAQRLRAHDPALGAIVLECANLPPYAGALGAAVGLPVYDWYSMVMGFAAGLAPRSFVALPIEQRPPGSTDAFVVGKPT
jgi:hypothetical protein